jgi:hypothetical protein
MAPTPPNPPDQWRSRLSSCIHWMTRAGTTLSFGLIVGLASQPALAAGEGDKEADAAADAERMALEARLDSRSLALTVDLVSRVERSTAERMTRTTRRQMAMLAERSERAHARFEEANERVGVELAILADPAGHAIPNSDAPTTQDRAADAPSGPASPDSR